MPAPGPSRRYLVALLVPFLAMLPPGAVVAPVPAMVPETLTIAVAGPFPALGPWLPVDAPAPTLDSTPSEQTRAGRALLKPAVALWEAGVEHISLMAADTPPLEPGAMSGEYAQLQSMVSKATPEQLWNGSFLLPVPGPITTSFGMMRVYDGGGSAEPHLGIDLAAVPGAAVVAANSGTVVFAGDWEVRGTAVVIDHGLGVYSGYYHLAELRVSPGQMVQRGEVIAAAGMTGVATGPHVHWDMMVRSAHVSPLDWVDLSNPVARLSEDGAWPVIADVRVQIETATQILGLDKAPPSPERFDAVRQAYHAMLGRTPDAVRDEELALWGGSEIAGDDLAEAIRAAGTGERSLAIRRLYVELLGRDPAGNDAGLTVWVDSLLTVDEIRQALVASPEGQRRALSQAH